MKFMSRCCPALKLLGGGGERICEERSRDVRRQFMRLVDAGKEAEL